MATRMISLGLLSSKRQMELEKLGSVSTVGMMILTSEGLYLRSSGEGRGKGRYRFLFLSEAQCSNTSQMLDHLHC